MREDLKERRVQGACKSMARERKMSIDSMDRRAEWTGSV